MRYMLKAPLAFQLPEGTLECSILASDVTWVLASSPGMSGASRASNLSHDSCQGKISLGFEAGTMGNLKNFALFKFNFCFQKTRKFTVSIPCEPQFPSPYSEKYTSIFYCTELRNSLPGLVAAQQERERSEPGCGSWEISAIDELTCWVRRKVPTYRNHSLIPPKVSLWLSTAAVSTEALTSHLVD